MRERLSADRQSASIDVQIGDRAGARVAADLTTGGIIAGAALVSAILLSTTLLVRVAVREGRRNVTAGRPPAGLPPSP